MRKKIAGLLRAGNPFFAHWSRVQEHTPLSEIDEGESVFARRMTDTLMAHLPPELRQYPHSFSEERSLAQCAMANLIRRVNLNDPADLLTEDGIVAVVNDVLCSREEGTFQKQFLQEYVEFGLIRPRYGLRQYETGGGARISLDLCIGREPDFNKEGRFQKVKDWACDAHVKNPRTGKTRPQRLKNRSASLIGYYKKQKLLIENPNFVAPGAIKKRYTTPLYLFSQVQQIQTVHGIVYSRVNLLTMAPTQYQTFRHWWLNRLSKRLPEDCAARFCHNTKCGRILPGVRMYCSKQCRQNDLKKQQRQPKPLPLSEEIPPLQSLALLSS